MFLKLRYIAMATENFLISIWKNLIECQYIDVSLLTISHANPSSNCFQSINENYNGFISELWNSNRIFVASPIILYDKDTDEISFSGGQRESFANCWWKSLIVSTNQTSKFVFDFAVLFRENILIFITVCSIFIPNFIHYRRIFRAFFRNSWKFEDIWIEITLFFYFSFSFFSGDF